MPLHQFNTFFFYELSDAWEKVYDTLQDSRVANYMKQIPYAPQGWCY